eukprot:3699678-Amphidinium_carterae.1
MVSFASLLLFIVGLNDFKFFFEGDFWPDSPCTVVPDGDGSCPIWDDGLAEGLSLFSPLWKNEAAFDYRLVAITDEKLDPSPTSYKLIEGECNVWIPPQRRTATGHVLSTWNCATADESVDIVAIWDQGQIGLTWPELMLPSSLVTSCSIVSSEFALSLSLDLFDASLLRRAINGHAHKGFDRLQDMLMD